ncbi:hypothetical protein L9F63_019712 [Diploptera punctata]|uniref:Uncharacterized protein n=1 Tax=Diploptera punctata TaxID=6984 RepID=A0AAD7ZTP7_DIPPU|nr:hypothetical protein L9F63_019712 [Diploptera punctata]
MLQVLKRAPNLKSIVIKYRNDVVRLLELLFDNCVSIKRLEIKWCKLEDNTMCVLDKIVAFYPELEELKLVGCDELTPTVGSTISQLRKLRRLNLSHNTDLSRYSIKIIVENCTRLEELCLQRIDKMYDEDVKHVISNIGAQLTTLKLDGIKLTDNSFCYLHHCTRLQVLDMTYCIQMTDKGLLEGIGALQELRSLSLRGAWNFTAQALSTFLHRPAMASIIYLNLYICITLDDYGLEGIALRCVHLKTLTLGWCNKVTDAGIMKVICNCKKLQILELEGVERITGTGYLDLVPTHLPLLKRLYLRSCEHIPQELLLKLVAAMPQLEVINHRGRIVSLLKENFRYWISWKCRSLYHYSIGN